MILNVVTKLQKHQKKSKTRTFMVNCQNEKDASYMPQEMI